MINNRTHHVCAPGLGIRFAAALLVLCGIGARSPWAHASQPLEIEGLLPPETLDDPPDVDRVNVRKISPAARISFGRFTSVQVNVDATGSNILHDASNEPSIAVDPNDPSRMAIGWRQFDSDKSNFRQAGFGYTTNAGLTWTTGNVEPGVFRSDPVLASNAQGKFFYNSLSHSSKTHKKKKGDFACDVFPSTDGGATWGEAVPAFGGDKEWMIIDDTSGPGHDQIYEAWSPISNPTGLNTFSRSIDGGQSFQSPTFVPNLPFWGTLDVASDGSLHLVGFGVDGVNASFYVSRSTDAQNPLSAPTFTTVPVNLGGFIKLGGPNPVGLLGQPWIAVDRTTGPRAGWIYVLCSVQTPTDPLDVMFVRSTDGGQTWSTPARVNDDAPGNGAYQWFGTMSVAPNGRIDVVWNDTRGSADITKSALYYSYSNDGGATWSANEQASPVWDSTVGWPRQQKIGDYYHMISRDDGADLAWAATFNGEQDIYYMSIPPPVVAMAGGGSEGARATSRAPDSPSTAERAPGLGSGSPNAGHLTLRGCQPNPFASSTAIRFDVPEAGEPVKLRVFDTAGRRVATLVEGLVGGGPHTARWNGIDDDGRAVTPGLYVCRLEGRTETQTLKLMLLRSLSGF